MQKWEYRTLYCTEIEFAINENGEQTESYIFPYPGKKLEPQFKLDPKLEIVKNSLFNKQLTWSEISQHWTDLKSSLNELGEEGWELVTSTPPWRSDNNVKTNYHFFHLIFKKLKKEK